MEDHVSVSFRGRGVVVGPDLHNLPNSRSTIIVMASQTPAVIMDKYVE